MFFLKKNSRPVAPGGKSRFRPLFFTIGEARETRVALAGPAGAEG